MQSSDSSAVFQTEHEIGFGGVTGRSLRNRKKCTIYESWRRLLLPEADKTAGEAPTAAEEGHLQVTLASLRAIARMWAISSFGDPQISTISWKTGSR